MGDSLLRYPPGQRMIEHGDVAELTVAAEMIEMGMGVDDDHRFIGNLLDGLPQVADATTRIDEGRPVLADDQIDDRSLVVTRLVESKEIRRDLVDLEPILAEGNPFEIGISRSGRSIISQFLAPAP